MIPNKTSTLRMLCFLAVICSVIFFIIVINSSANQLLEVQIIDYHTLKPIENAQVLVTQSGIGFVGRRFVWGQYYKYTSTTNSRGTIHAKNLSNQSVFIRVDHEKYISLSGTYPLGPTMTLKLKQKTKNHVALPWGNLEIGTENGRLFGWIFTAKRKTFDQNEADIFPQILNGSLYITATNGISFLSKETIGATNSLLTYTDFAPHDGYISKKELDFETTSGIYFVNTRDNNYAKFEFNAASGYSYNGSIQNLHGKDWTLFLKYVFNPDGSLNLTYQ